MTRERYLELRDSEPVDLLYEYYKENCKENCLNKQDFVRIVNMGAFNPFEGGVVSLFNILKAKEKLVNVLDKQFNINVLTSKEGDVLKVY